MAQRTVTIFGGSGFIGRYVVERLAARGDRIRIATRRPNNALFLKPMGAVGQIQTLAANIRNNDSIRRAVAGADVVINLVGVLHNSGNQTFDALQSQGAAKVAQLAAEAGVKTFVQMSAIGADPESESHYARTKGEGELAVRAVFPSAAILRPSLVIGHEDGFFNRFAGLIKMSPIVLPVPGTKTLFQPVYVGDVADAVVAATDGALDGKTVALGGPEVLSFKALLEILMEEIEAKRVILDMPKPLASLAGFFLSFLPSPPLTLDQVRLLSIDNIVGDQEDGLRTLDITPQPIQAVLPRYSMQYRPQGQFS